METLSIGEANGVDTTTVTSCDNSCCGFNCIGSCGATGTYCYGYFEITDCGGHIKENMETDD